mgnify:CR=1 FL=1
MYYFFRLYAGDRIASFFLDAYLRPAEKRGGAWMDECLGIDVQIGAIFKWLSKVITRLQLQGLEVGLKISRQFFNQ